MWTFFTLKVDKNWHCILWTTYPPHLVQVVFERPHRAVQKGFCFQPFQEVLLGKVGIVRFHCIGLTFGLIATSVNRLKNCCLAKMHFFVIKKKFSLLQLTLLPFLKTFHKYLAYTFFLANY